MNEFCEPWSFCKGLHAVTSDHVRDADYDLVVDDSPECDNDGRKLERAVACVNACAGIPTQTLDDLTSSSNGTLLGHVNFIASNMYSRLIACIELLDLYFGPNEGIHERKEAFLKKHGWEKREGVLGSVTMAGATSTPLVWEWVKGDRVCFLATALSEEVTEQFRRLKND